jgi:hypothetical protein
MNVIEIIRLTYIEIKSISLWQSNLHYRVFSCLKVLDSLSYKEDAIDFFF